MVKKFIDNINANIKAFYRTADLTKAIVVEEDKIKVDLPSYKLQGNVSEVSVVESTVLKVFLQKLLELTEHIKGEEIDKIGKLLLKAGKMIKDLRQKQHQLKKEVKRQEDKIKELKEYIKNSNALYGDFSPYMLLEDLYNGGKVNRFGILTPLEEFQAVNRKKYFREIRYWLSMFEEWEILTTKPKSQRVALVTRDKARQILQNKRGDIKNENGTNN
jgi:hypothetical protein